MARRPADRWDAHPVLAWWVRVAVLLVPVLVSVLVALTLIAVLPDPSGVAGHVAWWAAVLGSAYGAALLVDRLARRALPLAVLLRLSLVFPDRAPSRLRTARRTSLREIENQVADLESAGESGGPAEAARILVALVGALGLHDKRTRGHSERVRAYVDLLSEEMGLPEEDRVRLRWAALLHDIGKLSVPGPVLNGGRDLAEGDWAALRRHPAEGERLAGALLPWLGQWGRCVREHHERWDGSGYPQGLAGTDISLGARIVAVADAFEVMTANRSYQAAVKATTAREELARCAGKDFDPAVVRAFLQVSIGRLRGVLGPLSFLFAIPLAAGLRRVGDTARDITTVAAVTAVALAAPSPAAVPSTPTPGGRTPVVSLPSPRPALAPQAWPAPAPVAPVAPVVTPSSTTPTVLGRRATPRAVPRPIPTPAAPTGLLYLVADGSLAMAAPTPGQVTVKRWASFRTLLAQEQTISASPSLVLVYRVRSAPAADRNRVRAALNVVLADCLNGVCRTLSTGSASLRGTQGSFGQQVVPMTPVDTLVATGHELRLSLTLAAGRGGHQVVVACGGTMASRVVLG